MLIAVNYHYVRPKFEAPFPAIQGVTPSELRCQLEMLGSVGTFVSGVDVRNAIEHRQRLPDRSFLVTFDDGLREQIDHAWPVLASLGIPALFFVNTAPLRERKVSTVHQIHLLRSEIPDRDLHRLLIEIGEQLGIAVDMGGPRAEAVAHYPYDAPDAALFKYALNFRLRDTDRHTIIHLCFERVFGTDWARFVDSLYFGTDQVRWLASSGSLGSHSDEHVSLGRTTVDLARAMLRKGYEDLTKICGQSPYSLSYPFGGAADCTPEVMRAAGEVGFSFALTMERAVNRDLATPLGLARFSCNDLPGGKSPRFRLADLFESGPVARCDRGVTCA